LKPVNVRVANEFHTWQRANLPRRFVIQDIDTWVLALADSVKNYEPLALIELKRSTISPKLWTPFRDDLPNYVALFKLSTRAKLPLWVIYFTKEFEELALFNVRDVDPNASKWISYDKTILSPKQMREQFESIFS
jgi:hypothetical protein